MNHFFAIDTSGGVPDDILTDILTDICNTTQNIGRNESIIILSFDTEIRNMKIYNQYNKNTIKNYEFMGRGGTDAVCLLSLKDLFKDIQLTVYSDFYIDHRNLSALDETYPDAKYKIIPTGCEPEVLAGKCEWFNPKLNYIFGDNIDREESCDFEQLKNKLIGHEILDVEQTSNSIILRSKNHKITLSYESSEMGSLIIQYE